jgi:4'-phosphopantetheinyl transferase
VRADEAVHVWSVALDDARPERVRDLAGLLEPGERRRAERYLLPRSRDRFTVCRGLLRTILGHHAGERPERIRIRYGPHGKPAVDGLAFNVSHCGGAALIAVARGREVGVDLERVRPELPHLDMARRYFSRREEDELGRLPAASRARAFCDGWTRKESYLKALGTGLATPLASFSVSLAPGEPARFLEPAGDWTLVTLAAPPGFAAALTVAGACDRVSRAAWPR